MSEGRIEIKGLGLVAMLAFKLFAIAQFYGMAFNIKAISAGFGVPNAVAGSIISAELAGVAIGSLAFAFGFSRFTSRYVYLPMLLLLIAMQTATILAPSAGSLFAWRAGAGFAAGAILAAVTATVGRSTRPEALFGLSGSATHVMSALLALLLPLAMTVGERMPALAGVGAADGVFGLYLILALASLPFVARVPAIAGLKAGPRPKPDAAHTGPAPSMAGIVALAAFAVLLFGTSVVALYLVSLGTEQAGLGAQQVGVAMMIGSGLGMVTPLVTGYIGNRYGSIPPIALLLGLIAILALALGYAATPLAFYIAAPLFISVPLATMPLVMGAIARVDASGRLMAITPVASLVSIALAPVVGGAISGHGAYLANGWVCVGCAGLSLLLFVWALGRRPPAAGSVEGAVAA